MNVSFDDSLLDHHPALAPARLDEADGKGDGSYLQPIPQPKIRHLHRQHLAAEALRGVAAASQAE